VPPTDYTVVLEPYAVADMVRFLAYWMNGRALLDKRSFMSDRIGQSVTGANVSLWDDGTDPAGLPIAFDFEGVAKQRAVLVDKGVARGVVWDRRTAAEAGEGHASTGHALPAPNTFGPLPLNLFMAPRPGGSGERVSAQAEELVAGVANGLLVTRFNYVRAVHDARTVITGLTRDGTFAVRQGEVAHAVKNLRFTQSILGALGRVVDMSTGSKLLVGWIGALSVPALVIEGFRFTGATDF
jgi:predicted Zn-dependent protease